MSADDPDTDDQEAAPAQSAVNTSATPAPAQPAPQAQPASGQGVPTKTVAQSEPDQPQQGASSGPPRPVLDPRPYQWLKENAPDRAEVVDSVAKENGVSPQRVALHWYQESQFKYNAPNGAAGEVGPVQIMPDTAKRFGNNGRLDPSNPIDNLRIGAGYMRHLDNTYGKDTPSSVGAYQGGEGSINDMAANPGMAAKNHPNTLAYIGKAFPGFTIDPAGLTGQTKATPQGLVQSGSQGGPQGFLQYIAQTAPRGMPLTDAWQHAEGMLTQAFLEKGDVEGAQHARDFVLQMSHTGSNQFLMQAHQSLSSGDTMGAAQALAKAHAFFPDGSIGKFGTDAQGNLWGQRFDEHNPTQPIGAKFQVTPDGIASMLNQTTDPNKYLQMVLQEQKVTTAARHEQVLGQYYADRTATQSQNALTAAGRLDEENRHNLATEAAAGNKAAKISGAATPEQANKAADTLYGPDSDNATIPLEQRAKLSAIMKDTMQQGSSATEGQFMAEGLGKGTMGIGQPEGNRAPVIGKKDGQVHGYISLGLAHRLAGSQGPTGAQQGVSTSPVGAGAGTPAARASGVSSNLAGTQTQSSAVPAQPGQ